MKIINVCTRGKPPVIRVPEYQRKAICYELDILKCDIDDLDSKKRAVLYQANMIIPNVFKDADWDSGLLTYTITSDDYSYEGTIRILGNKFRIITPELPAGYYYLSVVGYGGKNVIMINVI